MKLYRRLFVLLLAALLLPLSARAAGSNSITIRYDREGQPIAGAAFQLYRMTGTYETAQDAYAAVLTTGQKPLVTAETDAQGTALFSGLDDGTYLLTGTPHKVGDKILEPEMSLLTLPGKDEAGNPLADITVQPKFEVKNDTALIEYRVIVLWEDAPTAYRTLSDQWKHPEVVDVYLYRNGTLEDTVQPGRTNNWQQTWTETDPTAIWAVVEDVPDGYTARYDRDGNTFIIINTPKVEDPSEPTETEPEETKPQENTKPQETTKPSGPKLPQTGQLWWPVPVLALIGFVLFLLGWIRRKESRDET